MAVDLGDLIEDLQSEVSPPGTNMFSNATDDEWLSNLRNGFWNARIDGILAGYTEEDGEIITDNDGDDMPRDLQQVIVFYAGYRILFNSLRQIGTLFRAKAGPVEYETQNSAQLLKALLDDLIGRRNILLQRLSDLGAVQGYLIDNVIARDRSIGWGDTWFIGG